MGTLHGIVQGNHIYPGGNMTTISIMCGLMEDANSTLDVLSVLASPPDKKTKCRDNSYTKSLGPLKNHTWGESMDRQWTWQTCNEFGFFQSAGGVESPFHPLAKVLSVDYYLQICQDAYKLPPPPPQHQEVETIASAPAKFNHSVPTAFTNSYYGARDLGASRVILPDGSVRTDWPACIHTCHIAYAFGFRVRAEAIRCHSSDQNSEQFLVGDMVAAAFLVGDMVAAAAAAAAAAAVRTLLWSCRWIRGTASR
jgi:hypothetical protein